jgi:UDP-N-acetylglucosamine 2-epimerase (non-hydrolysing)
MKIVSVVGARPNFMKIAPFIRAVCAHNDSSISEKIHHILVHTGQHYDDRMSNAFFEALGIPQADINLGVGSGTHAEQVGYTMIAFEKVIKKEKPDWVVVVGDVNATCACSITAKKENVKLAHIEAGLRSRDMTMPEEINRLVTDRLSDLSLTPDEMSSQNLVAEGVPKDKIRFVGNIMIDTLEANVGKAKILDVKEILKLNLISENEQKAASIKLSFDRFALLTLHRPYNVDEKTVFEPIVRFLTDELVKELPLLWILHPRSEKQLKLFGLWDHVIKTDNLLLLSPLGYQELLRLNMAARMMLTDSGGLQEECCVLGTPCLTLRWNTERPVTLQENGGASVLVGNDVYRIRKAFMDCLQLQRKPLIPDLWDGRTSERIVKALLEADSD